MSTEEDKFKHSRRILKDDNAISKQLKIAKSNSAMGKMIEEPHRMAKHHVMNCGNSNCLMCGNPRKIFNEKTMQEQRMEQDMDTIRDRHSNGTVIINEDEK
jgi:hypothetical protein